MISGDVVKVTRLDGGIAVISLEDREAKNFFSDACVAGITEAFAGITTDASIRVAVIHGYDNYFCCGGTRDQLIKIAEGRAKYTDFTFFDGLRHCPIPTIAAMQGHAIGGGLAFALHADFHVFGEESVYSANFMEYGFTPGMGSTFTIPQIFGDALGWEMLFTGGNYRGAELKARGAPIVVRPRADVVSHALDQARVLARKPLESLRELKRRRLEITRAEFESAVQREVEMQNITFPLPAVQERIRTIFRD
ncbi:MAG: polyketide synthase [Verrucomicrobiota bacterium]